MNFLRRATRGMVPPASTSIIAQYGKDPYLILIGCILSLRTKDKVSLPAAMRLFEYARTPETILQLPLEAIEKLIYPVGFFRVKAQTIHRISAQIISGLGGKVPHAREELLSLHGVGLKTANLVLGEAFGIPAICVDTHVHKISNRLGLVNTKTPEQTEAALREILPEQYWIEYGRLLVTWGQNVCVPIAPLCSICVLSPICPKKGVSRKR